MKKIIFILLSVIMIASLVGCGASDNESPSSDVEKKEDSGNNEGITVNTIKFERIMLEDLDKDLRAQIDQNKIEAGYKLFEAPEEGYHYLAVFAGEKPSAGYDIKITKVIDNKGVTSVSVTETAPADGQMVAEVITYPLDIVKLTGISDNIKITYNKQKNDLKNENKDKLSENPDESTSMIKTTYVEGQYMGQIDPHTIEVKVDGKLQAFQLRDNVKQQVSSFNEEEIIKFDYLTNDKGQNVIVSFKQEKQSVIGDFEGQIDPHSIEVIIEDGPQVFQLNDAAISQVKGFKKGDLIKIEYVKNEHGQMVANSITKAE